MSIKHTFKKSPGAVSQISVAAWIVGVLFVLLGGGLGYSAWYGYQRIAELSLHIATVEAQLATTSLALEGSIENAQTSLTSELSKERERVAALNDTLGSFQKEVGTISGTVTTLEKLSKTDPELLQKYSKVFFLNEHYAPERVVEIPDEYEYFEERHAKIHELVWPHLQNMMDSAKAQNHELFVYSAHRPFEEQRALKGQYSVTYGAGTANTFSADQGYSEHQLGTTVDFITTGIGGSLEGFDTTDEYQWLISNAYKFGFVLSYPPSNSYYVFEPWHWRYVGIKLATDLKNQGKYFYDLDQREIDEYLINLF